MKRNRFGFTIVELLIVIVVIGILAAISIVAYNNVQQKASDSRMRDGVAQFEKALQMWTVENGNTLMGNSGSSTALSGGKCTNGGSEGFVATGTYSCTTEDMLVAAQLLPAGFVSKLPKNIHYTGLNNGLRSIMLYKCHTQPGHHILFWTLQSPTADDTSNLSSVLSTCGRDMSIPNSYGMKAAKIVRFGS